MTHYYNINLRDVPGLSKQDAMSVAVTALHFGLVKSRLTGVGFSFPEYAESLGSVIRVHGGKEDLDAFLVALTLERFSSLAEFSELQPTPEGCKHRIVRRVQPRDSSSRARRHARRGNSTVCVDGYRPLREPLALPYVTIRSLSTSQTFRLFIEHGELLDAPKQGRFSAYGLSDQATVPWF